MSRDHNEAGAAPRAVRFGPFRLDREDKLLFRDGEVVALTPKAFEMLDLLVKNAGRIVEKDVLLRGVWPDTFVDEANLSHHVFALRKALGDDREGTKYIETVPRRGYRFVPRPESETASEESGMPVPQESPPSLEAGVESETGPPPATVIPDTSLRRHMFRNVAVGLTLLATGLLVGWMMASRPAPPSTLRFAIAPPPGTTFPQAPATNDLAISPDGRTLAMVAMDGQRRKLFVRPLDRTAAVSIEGTDGAAAPFWSPDGQWIGFFTGALMKKVPLAGGPPETICPARGGMASWNRDGQILFFDWGLASNETARLVSSNGGQIREIKVPTDSAWWPAFLPDGRHFTYYSLVAGERRGLYVGSVDGGASRLVSSAPSRGEVHGDHLYYVRDAALVKQKIDLRTFALEGDSVPIASPAFCFTPTGSANFSVSADGSVVVLQRRSLATQLVWRDWSGHETGRVGEPELYRRFAISPDGRRLAIDLQNDVSQSSSVWILDLDRGVRTRMTPESRFGAAPQWTHRGDALVLCLNDPATPSSAPTLSLLHLDDGSVQRLRPAGSIKYATSLTADDSWLIITMDQKSSTFIYVASMTDPKAVMVWEGSDAFDASDGVLSPDGRWLAYQSSESGRPEIYVRRFRGPGEKLRVSARGGTEPQWAPDGKAVLFISGGMLIKSDLTAGDTPRVTSESFLFPINSAGMMEQALGQSHYAVTAERILVREIPGGEDRDPIQVIVTSR
jgi:DNA-binding winged helix-turn-helix (wHTH) protein/Tol biopolymer transport system component